MGTKKRATNFGESFLRLAIVGVAAFASERSWAYCLDYGGPNGAGHKACCATQDDANGWCSAYYGQPQGVNALPGVGATCSLPGQNSFNGYNYTCAGGSTSSGGTSSSNSGGTVNKIVSTVTSGTKKPTTTTPTTNTTQMTPSCIASAFPGESCCAGGASLDCGNTQPIVDDQQGPGCAVGKVTGTLMYCQTAPASNPSDPAAAKPGAPTGPTTATNSGTAAPLPSSSIVGQNEQTISKDAGANAPKGNPTGSLQVESTAPSGSAPGTNAGQPAIGNDTIGYATGTSQTDAPGITSGGYVTLANTNPDPSKAASAPGDTVGVDPSGNVTVTNPQGQVVASSLGSGQLPAGQTAAPTGVTQLTSGGTYQVNPDGTVSPGTTADATDPNAATFSVSTGLNSPSGSSSGTIPTVVTVGQGNTTATLDNNGAEVQNPTEGLVATQNGVVPASATGTAANQNTPNPLFSQNGSTSTTLDCTKTPDNPECSKTANGSVTSLTKGSDSLCPISETIGGAAYKNCDATSKLMEASTVTTTVGQIAGSTTLSAEGSAATSNLQANGGSQSQAYMASAQLSQKASEAQLAIGGAQMIMGYLENSAGGKHKAAANALSGAADQGTYRTGASPTGIAGGVTAVNSKITDTYAQSAASIYGGATNVTSNKSGGAATLNSATGRYDLGGGNTTDGAIPNAVINGASLTTYGYGPNGASQARAIMNNVAKNASDAAAKGITQQTSMAQKASSQGFTDLLTGGKTFVAGILAYASAKQAEEAAAKMTTAVSAQPPAADPFNTSPIVASAPTAITGGTTATTTPTTTSEDAPTGAIGTGGGEGSSDGSSVAGNAAAPFTPGVGSGGSGGGLTAGGGGSTNTAPATAAADAEPTAKYANNSSAGVSYEGSGATGGGGKAAGADTGALSLKDAFAALMNQDGAKKDDSGVDIMAFRKLASDDSYAPLGTTDDFFTYIHTAYQGLQKKGRIGL